MSARDWGLIAALSFLWGGAFLFITIGLRDLPPNTLVLIRMVVASLPLLLFV
jgi:uncharacterized membrane protein